MRLIKNKMKNFFHKQKRLVANEKTLIEKLDLLKFKIVFDVGAFQGKFIDDISKINPNIFFHCFEPSTESFTSLQKKYQQTNIVINNCAVSNFNGSALLNINTFKETNSLLDSAAVNETINLLTQNQSTEEVQVISLNEYCSKNRIDNIDLIKIDTQGNSYNVLLGLEKMLQLKKVSFLYVEAEFIEIYKNEKLFSEIEILMRGYGYFIVDLFNLNYLDNQRLAWCDILFKAVKD